MEELRKVIFLKMISLLVYFGLNTISYGEQILKQNLSEHKKTYINTLNEIRKNNLMEIQYESSNLMDISNTNTNGENFLAVMDEKEKKINSEIGVYSIFNKKDYLIKTNINMYKKSIIEDKPLEYGAGVAYSYNKLNDMNIHSFSISPRFKTKLENQKVSMSFINEIKYSNLLDGVNKNNLYFIQGSLNAKVHLASKINIIPEIRLGYNYTLPFSIKDINKDEIEIKSNLDLILGMGVATEYKFGKSIKTKLGLKYSFDRLFLNKEKFKLFDKDIIDLDEYNNLVHNASVYSLISINDRHNVKMQASYRAKKYSLMLLYNYNW